jgi:hypothetical protein
MYTPIGLSWADALSATVTRTGIPTPSCLPEQVSKAGRRLYLDGRLHGFFGSMASARAMAVMAIVTVVVVSRRLVLV